ncbi:MAG: hypothetical protein EOO68_09780 [Moraxellaceae bacterium]|nr:MAG: hypothetical protein EOO68_09780 [Moraxellaceae bacterium]
MSVTDFSLLTLESFIKLFKHPMSGRKTCANSYYVRFKSGTTHATGPYSFSENIALEKLCLLFNDLGFIFWGTFKSEITPVDYMRYLQRRGILLTSFKAIEAGEETIKKSP